jgi:hypothetical protein
VKKQTSNAEHDENGFDGEGLHRDFGLPWNKKGKLANGRTLQKELKREIKPVGVGEDITVNDIAPFIRIESDGSPTCYLIETNFEVKKRWISHVRSDAIEEVFENLDIFEAMVLRRNSSGDYLLDWEVDEPELDSIVEDASDRSEEIELAVQEGWTRLTREWNAPVLRVNGDALEEHGRYEMVSWYSRDEGIEFNRRRNDYEDEHFAELNAVDKLVRKHGLPFEDAKNAVAHGLKGKAAAHAFRIGIDFDLMNSVVNGEG